MPIDPATVITSISAALGFARDLIAVDKVIDEAAWKLKLAELTSALADAKIGAVELKSEIEQRDGEITRLRAAFEFKGKTIKRNDMVYEMQDNGGPVGMPFCPRCLTVDGRYIKLAETMQNGRPAYCPQCKSDFGHQSRYTQQQ